MATIEEERAKVDARGIQIPSPVPLSTVNPVVQGIQNIAAMSPAEKEQRLGARMLRDTSTFLRTPPNAQNVASSAIFNGQPAAVTQTVSPPPPAETGSSFGMPMSSANLDRAADAVPRSYEYVPGKNQPLTGPAPEGATRTVRRNADTGVYYTEDVYADGRNVKTAAERIPSPTTGGPPKAATSQEQGIRREVINGNVNTQFGGGMGQKLTVQPGYAPQLKTAYTSPQAFSQIIGYDRNENPIYNDAAAAMRAANEGISAQNRSAIDKFQQENALYASVTGGVPLQQAQAQLAGTTASEMPGENLSQQELRTDQGFRERQQGELFAEQAKVAGMPKPPTVHYGETETMVPGGGIEQTPYASVVQDGELRILSPKQGGQSALANLAAELSQPQRKIATKYIKADQTPEEKATILSRIRSGELQ